MISFTVPWPPSANRYYRHLSKGPLAGRTLISEDGRAYCTAVMRQMKLCRVEKAIGRLRVELYAYPPDRRLRDLGNVEKALLDALQKAEVIANDGDIDYLSITRCAIRAGGCVTVNITSGPHVNCAEIPPLRATAGLFDGMSEGVPF